MSDKQSVSPPDYSVNHPGQSSIFYRATTHAQSLARMKARLSQQQVASGPNKGQKPLAALTNLAESEPTVALLDAWSAVLDVLTFYQERNAQEGFLRTATESRSVRWLAQSVGYRPKPAVAASTYLTFVVDDSTSTLTQVNIPKGTQVLSVPVGTALPQTFETQVALTARATWNQLLPNLVQPQQLVASNQSTAGTVVSSLRLLGLSTGLQVGSLLRVADATTVQVKSVTRDTTAQQTEIGFQVVDGPSVRLAPLPVLPLGNAVNLPRKLSESVVETHILGRAWEADDLAACMEARGWSEAEVTRIVSTLQAKRSAGSVLAYRQQAAFFGADAPSWSSLPKLDAAYLRGTDLYAADSSSWDESTAAGTATSSKTARNKRTVWEDSWGALYSASTDSDVFLERVLTGVAVGSSVLLAGSAGYRSLTVRSLSAATVRGYGKSARCTGVSLSAAPTSVAAAQADGFLTRDTVMYLQSESVSLTAAVPSLDESAVVDGLVLSSLALGLRSGQAVLVAGEHADQSGVTSSEIAFLRQVVHQGGLTQLYFSAALSCPRVRSSVTVCANVALATHGKTVAGEVLGSGDAGQKNQSFVLKQGPLTYLSDDSELGASSTLSVRVDGVLWREVSSLIDQDGRSPCFVISHADSGQVTVTFGDGEHGARLPSGQDNVVASYRVGSGPDGEVAAGALQLLLTRPTGLRSVANPLAATGAGSDAAAAALQEAVPLSVATLGRAVSLSDHEAMAKSYPGIAKAQATAVRSVGAPAVHLTVATDDGEPLLPTSALYQGLCAALRVLGEETQPLFIDDYQPRYFQLRVLLAVDARYEVDLVREQTAAALTRAFSFAVRSFAQAVRAAEVLHVVQQVPGVLGAQLESLWLQGTSRRKSQLLSAAPARLDGSGRSVGAELLLLSLDDDSVGVLP